MTAPGRRTIRTVGIVGAAFFLLAGESSCFDNLVTLQAFLTANQAKITVGNAGTEPGFAVLYADDGYVGGSLSPGGVIGIETHVEGSYTVVVRPSGEAVRSYQQSLGELARLTREMQLPGPAGSRLHDHRRQIEITKAGLRGLRDSPETAASCTGSVSFPDFEPDRPAEPVRISATVQSYGDGIWAAHCP